MMGGSNTVVSAYTLYKHLLVLLSPMDYIPDKSSSYSYTSNICDNTFMKYLAYNFCH